MKKIISWFLGCLALATMTTCNNEKYLPIYTIEGKLYWDCERMMPVRNATIQAIQVGAYKNVNGKIILGEATTDSTGYFKLDYKIKDSYAWASYELMASGTNLYKTLKTSKEKMQYKGDLFVKNVANLNMTFKKGQQVYTANDTLYYALMRDQGLIMTPKTVTNLQNMETVNVSITNVDITRFLENEGRFVYGVGLQQFAYYYAQRSGQDSPLIKFTDCNKNQQITIELP